MTGIPERKKYVPDLAGFMLLCELNYLRLLKLLPQIEPCGKVFEYQLQEALTYRLTIIECCKYTTIITISQIAPSTDRYVIPMMEVRLYHDAQVAEVTTTQNIRGIKASYDYPNPLMMQRDEKMQINQFLQDWLKLCHQHGQVTVDLSAYLCSR